MSKKKTEPEQATDDKWKKFAEEPEVEQEPENSIEEPREGIEFPSRETLEEELTGAEKEAFEYKERFLRLQAELENLRRRSERDISNAHKYGNEKLLAELLPVIDSMLRGLEGPEPNDPKLKAMHDGLVLTLDMLEKTVQKFGVQVIDPAKGEPFNPEMHEAMAMQPDPEADSKTVLQVVQRGYSLNGRVLRAAMVIVAQ